MTADTVQPLLVKLPLAGTQTFAGRSQNPYYITALYYPFISMGAIPSILPQDLQFLESQCCIHVPTRPIMDELMRQYFLHLHPMLPIINEASFWNIYSSDTGEYALDDRIPLIVLQAMLFACCNVSQSSIAFGMSSLIGILRCLSLSHCLFLEISDSALPELLVLLSTAAQSFYST